MTRQPSPAVATNAEAFTEWTEAVRSRGRTITGVASIANAAGVPIRYVWKLTQLAVDNRRVTVGWSAAGWVVSHGYFATMGTRIVDGREFTDTDDRSAEPVVVVSRALARRLWPGQSALCHASRHKAVNRRAAA